MQRRNDEPPETEQAPQPQQQPAPLGFSEYRALAEAAHVDYRSLKREYENPGSVKGRAGMRARQILLTIRGEDEGEK